MILDNLAKSFKQIMFIAPTTSAVKNLLDRAKELNVSINVDTYHRCFGVSCRDVFDRDKYDIFILDECSMVGADMLKFILSKLKPHQSLILAGDWCDTGWPATMEGAVRSGYVAADAITKKNSLQQELPAAFFARVAGLG